MTSAEKNSLLTAWGWFPLIEVSHFSELFHSFTSDDRRSSDGEQRGSWCQIWVSWHVKGRASHIRPGHSCPLSRATVMDYQLFETHTSHITKSLNCHTWLIEGNSGELDVSICVMEYFIRILRQGSSCEVHFHGNDSIFYFDLRISLEMYQTSLSWVLSGRQDNLEQRGNSSLVDSACPLSSGDSAGTFLRSRPIHSPKTGDSGVSPSGTAVITITQQLTARQQQIISKQAFTSNHSCCHHVYHVLSNQPPDHPTHQPIAPNINMAINECLTSLCGN